MNRFKKSTYLLLSLLLLISCNQDDVEEETIIDCTELDFDISLKNQLEYTFIADFKNEKNIRYAWSVNGKEIEEDGNTTANVPDNKLSLVFDPGSYEVCMISKENCGGTKVFCRNVTASVDCPDFKFVKNGTTLAATFPGVKSFPRYSWYIDDERIKVDGNLEKGNNTLDISDLTVGTYSICIQSDYCPDVSYCEEITIKEEQPDCPVLTFRREDGNFLVANFVGVTTFKSYSWFVDGVEKEKEGTEINGDNRFDLNTLNEGIYSICIKSDQCPNSATFCEDIEVIYEVNCRILFYERQGDLLVANFEGIENERSYNWHVNGKIQKKDGVSNNGNNQFDLTQLQDGSYRVCILTEGCDFKYDYCRKNIEVGDQNNAPCPNLNFRREGNQLVADFPGINSHSLYKWVRDSKEVKDDGVSVNGNNRLDLSNLSPGTYKFCIFSPGCEIGNYFCSKITIN